MTKNAVSVSDLTKKYEKQIAIRDIHLALYPGEINVLLGSNGAGKTTLIKCICGLLRFSGAITIHEHDNRSLEAKALLGYVPEIAAVYPLLTVGEHMEFIARAYRLADWQDRATELLERFEIADIKDKLASDFSKGMKQKLSICCALLPNPEVIIFDEPLSGLDPHGIRQLMQLITTLRSQGKSILYSTHMIETIETEWDTAFILNKGRMVFNCRREEQIAENLESVYFSQFEDKEVN